MDQSQSTARRLRLGNGRVVRVTGVPEGLRCPVCGYVYAARRSWWRAPEPIDVGRGADIYLLQDYDICDGCFCEYGCDAELGPEPGAFADNRRARAEWLRKVGRAPEPFQQVLWNLGIVPDHEEPAAIDPVTGRDPSGASALTLAVIHGRDDAFAVAVRGRCGPATLTPGTGKDGRRSSGRWRSAGRNGSTCCWSAGRGRRCGRPGARRR